MKMTFTTEQVYTMVHEGNQDIVVQLSEETNNKKTLFLDGGKIRMVAIIPWKNSCKIEEFELLKLDRIRLNIIARHKSISEKYAQDFIIKMVDKIVLKTEEKSQYLNS